jgi:hypothetical protein
MSVKVIGGTSGTDADVDATPKALRTIEYNPDGTPVATNLAQTIAPAANTGGTITLPAVAGKFHYITKVHIQRNATAALAGTATLAVTTTNINNTPSIRVGNAMAAGGTQSDADLTFWPPLKSSVANTATTFVFPAPGAAVLWTATVYYYVAP